MLVKLGNNPSARSLAIATRTVVSERMRAIPPVDPTEPPTGVQRAMHRIGMSRPGRWFGIGVSSRVDPFLLRATGGRVSTTAFFPILLLTVRGRKTGEPRTVPLVYFTQGDEVILTASSFGRAKHPAWYWNVKANPEVELRARGRGGRYVARETEGPERDRLFELSKQLYAGYRMYEERATTRTIPVFALRQAEDPGENRSA